MHCTWMHCHTENDGAGHRQLNDIEKKSNGWKMRLQSVCEKEDLSYRLFPTFNYGEFVPFGMLNQLNSTFRIFVGFVRFWRGASVGCRRAHYFYRGMYCYMFMLFFSWLRTQFPYHWCMWTTECVQCIHIYMSAVCMWCVKQRRTKAVGDRMWLCRLMPLPFATSWINNSENFWNECIPRLALFTAMISQ